MIYPFPWRVQVRGKSNFRIKKIYTQERFKKISNFLLKELKVSFSSRREDSDLMLIDINYPEAKKRGKEGLKKLKNEESYFLDTTKSPFIIASSSEKGIWWGIQSLIQLKEENEWIRAKVWDEPAFPVRGMHLYLPSRKNISFFKKWLKLLSRLKYNTLFLEVGGGMEYKKHPEINKAWEKLVKDIRKAGGEIRLREKLIFPKDSMHPEIAGGSYLTQEEVRELVEYARSLRLEVIPEVQSLSHCYYLCCAHPEIAERKDDPYPDTYCPFHPYTYPLLFDVLEEVIEVFKPRMIHMGHDEWYQVGICPRCKNKDPAFILSYDVKKIHHFLSAHGVKMAIWGDKLMNIIVGGKNHGGRSIPGKNIRGDTYPATEMIPKDILILDWYWWIDTLSEKYVSSYGFDEIFGNFHPLLFYKSEERFSSPNVKGGEVSSWCEVEEEAFAYLGIIQNVLFSASAFWWKNYADREKETIYRKVKEIIPQVRRFMGGLEVPEGEEETLKLDEGFSRNKVLKLGKKVKAIKFIHFSPEHFEFIPTWRFLKNTYPEKYYLGKYIIKTRSQKYEVPVIYWLNILYPYIHPLISPLRSGGGTGNALLYYADIYREGKDKWGKPLLLYSLPWINPDPEDEIEEIILEGRQILAKMKILY